MATSERTGIGRRQAIRSLAGGAVATVASASWVESLTALARQQAQAHAATAVIAQRRPHVILMDLQLPGVDGLELTRRLKADPATRDITIIAVTAYAMKGDEDKALAAGCDDYVTKPIDTRALPELIRRHAVKSEGMT